MMRLLPLLLLLAPLAGCQGLFRDKGPYPISEAERENSAAYVDIAAQEIEEGKLSRALDRLVAVRDIENLPPEVRLRSEELIDRCASLLLARSEGDLDDLDDLWQMELSPRMRARAGVRYAERLYEEGHRVDAFKQVRDLENELPNHSEGARAGEVLARTGLDLIRDPGRYWVILRYRTRGIAALEYLVLTYPLDPTCPEAYAALARAYEESEDLDYAIDRHEYLLLYHPSSPQAVVSEATIPRLRLDQLDGDDFDRGELIRAQGEIESWLARHGGHELYPEVDATLLRCRRMLADNDLYLSRYYRRIGNDFGARVHAERALVEAGSAGAQDREEQAQRLLDALPPAEEAP
ncbi:MAG: hypothetical protein AAF682_17780 [Planctomycetota bacterium]